MKKWLIGVMTVLMAVSLAACTPTTEKQKKETTAAAAAKSQEDMVPPSTGGASDKVPDPNVPYITEAAEAWCRIWIPWTRKAWTHSCWWTS